MISALAIEPGVVRQVELPARPPGAGEVQIRVRTCAVCTWEMRAFSGEERWPKPLLGGHEIAGEVVARDPSLSGFVALGDHVAVARLAGCGYCDPCRRLGNANHCENLGRDGSYDVGPYFGPAGFSELLTVPADQVFRLDRRLDLAAGGFVEPLSCAIRSVAGSGLELGDDALVFGAGVMGLLHVQLIRLRGGRAIVLEPNPRRRSASLEHGAAAALDPSDDGVLAQIGEVADEGAAAAFVTGGGSAAFEQALALLRPGGRVVAYASTDAMLEVAPARIHSRELGVIGTVSQTPRELAQAARLLNRGLVEVGTLISETYPIEEGQRAFERALSTDTYRVVIRMDGCA